MRHRRAKFEVEWEKVWSGYAIRYLVLVGNIKSKSWRGIKSRVWSLSSFVKRQKRTEL